MFASSAANQSSFLYSNMVGRHSQPLLKLGDVLYLAIKWSVTYRGSFKRYRVIHHFPIPML